MAKAEGKQPAVSPAAAPAAPEVGFVSTRELVKPVVTVAEAKKFLEEYAALCDAVLTDTDYIYYLSYRQPDGAEEREKKPFLHRAFAEEGKAKLISARMKDVEILARKKRSAFDKLAKFYNLTVPMEEQQERGLAVVDVSVVGDFIVERRVAKSFVTCLYQNRADLTVVKANCLISVVAPNGRTGIGEASCSVSERRRGAEGFAHPDHDIPSTAFTRAWNRAVSRCLGVGEVSAEELETDVATDNEKPAGAPIGPSPSFKPAATSSSATQHPESAAQSQSVIGEGATSGDPETRYLPPPEGRKLEDRIRQLELHLLGGPPEDSRRENHLVKYLFFLVPTAIEARIEKQPGRWDPALWRAAIIKLEDRKARMSFIEGAAASMARPEFIAWARETVQAKNFGGET